MAIGITFVLEFLFLKFEPRTSNPLLNILTAFNRRGNVRPIYGTNSKNIAGIFIRKELVWFFGLLAKNGVDFQHKTKFLVHIVGPRKSRFVRVLTECG